MRRVYQYLVGKRTIDKEVFSTFANHGLIYESAEYHNAVFVGKDKDGTMQHISLRGTGGDFRVSNFLLWQSAYSEYVVLDTLWPDFCRDDIEKCVKEFYMRDRRYGGLSTEDKKV